MAKATVKSAPAIVPDEILPPTPSPTVAAGRVSIDFHNRSMPVKEVGAEQMALLIDAQDWFKKAKAGIDGLADVEEDAADDDPRLVEGRKLAQRGIKHVGRLQTILQNLFEDSDDWDWIQDGMADRSIPWQDVAELPYLILRAHNDAAVLQPDNRQTRRATKRGRRTT